MLTSLGCSVSPQSAARCHTPSGPRAVSLPCSVLCQKRTGLAHRPQQKCILLSCIRHASLSCFRRKWKNGGEQAHERARQGNTPTPRHTRTEGEDPARAPHRARAVKGGKNITGPEVRCIRFARSLSQPALAAACQRQGWDIGRDTIAKIERGTDLLGQIVGGGRGRPFSRAGDACGQPPPDSGLTGPLPLCLPRGFMTGFVLGDS